MKSLPIWCIYIYSKSVVHSDAIIMLEIMSDTVFVYTISFIVLSGVQVTKDEDKFDIPELVYNLNLLVDLAESEILQIDRQ